MRRYRQHARGSPPLSPSNSANPIGICRACPVRKCCRQFAGVWRISRAPRMLQRVRRRSHGCVRRSAFPASNAVVRRSVSRQGSFLSAGARKPGDRAEKRYLKSLRLTGNSAFALPLRAFALRSTDAHSRCSPHVYTLPSLWNASRHHWRRSKNQILTPATPVKVVPLQVGLQVELHVRQHQFHATIGQILL